jgi:hypothetical protein
MAVLGIVILALIAVSLFAIFGTLSIGFVG